MKENRPTGGLGSVIISVSWPSLKLKIGGEKQRKEASFFPQLLISVKVLRNQKWTN